MSEKATSRTCYKRTEDKNAFAEIIEKSGAIYIVPHINPDPDALASSLAMTHLLKRRFKKDAEILVAGIIGREENKTLVKECHISHRTFTNANIKKGDTVILLDTQPSHGNSPLPKTLTPDIVIDHHPYRKKTERIPYYDVRPGWGATATILYEYMVAFDVSLTRGVATALFYGLKTDTSNLTRNTTKDDIETYQVFLTHANAKAIGRIEKPDLPLDYYKYIHSGLEKAIIYDNVLVVNFKEVTQPDYVPLIADFFVSYERADWVLVSGRFNEQLIISLRNIHTRRDAGELLVQIIGKRGEGGGHHRYSAGRIRIKDVSEKEIDKIEKEIVSRLLTELKGKILIGEGLLH